MKKNNITVGTEVFFYNDMYGFFSDRVVRIEGTKAVFTGWPKYTDPDSGRKSAHYQAYMVSISSIKDSAYQNTKALMQYVPGGAGLRGFDGKQDVNCSLDKKEVLELYLKQLDYKKSWVVRQCEDARIQFEKTLDKVGVMETEENRIKEELAKL